MAYGVQQSAWLLCEIIEGDVEGSLVKSELFDGETIEFAAPGNKIKDRAEAHGVWVKCKLKGQQGNIVGLILPGPVLRHGTQVNVDIQQVSFHPDPA